MIICPTSTSAHPMSRHNFDRTPSTKLSAVKLGICLLALIQSNSPFFRQEKTKNTKKSVFQVVTQHHACPAKIVMISNSRLVGRTEVRVGHSNSPTQFRVMQAKLFYEKYMSSI